MQPKPKYCGQDWLEMTPTDTGRICRQCSKTIVDFSKMSWSNISAIQEKNNNSVCGMYSQKQLDYWGQEIPKNNYPKTIAATALLLSLASSTKTVSQTTASTISIKKTIIRGTVVGQSQKGNTDTLAYTNISLKNSKIGTVTDIHGNYELDITNYIDTIQKPTIVFSMLGYNTLELKLDSRPNGSINYNAILNQDNISITYFYVKKPTLAQKIKWKFKKWFSRKDS